MLEDAKFYHSSEHWSLRLFLLMPDHVHMIAGFSYLASMSKVVRDWKRLTARRAGINWQRDYFDHRLRPGESLQQKAAYIRENPVRAGLVSKADDWPYFLDDRSLTDR